MYTERMTETEKALYARRVRRARRARQIRRVQGCLLAIVWMIGLAVCSSVYSARRAAEQGRQEARTYQTRPLQIPSSAAPADQEPSRMDGTEPSCFVHKELAVLVSGVLKEIITDGMTPVEQTRAVFDYAHDSIAYTGSSDKSDWEAGACEGLTDGKGDCFTYYAVSRALLTALGIDNLPVERTGGETHHYWNLVNCGNGWYHFDACPRSSRLPDFFSFLFTDQQAADFTAEAGRNYYDFDSSLLPERATEAIVWD